VKKYKTALSENQSLLEKLGPGLITGAADDDPSGIATYSQVGAAFGYGMLWTAIVTFPLMIGIQVVSARIGRVTGNGIAANIRNHYPPWLLYGLIMLLLVANTINIAADIGAMGAALKLLIGGPAHWYAIGFGVASLLLQVFVPFPRYSPILKALTLALFAYVGTVFVVKVPWGHVLYETIIPSVSFNVHYAIGVVAVFGTTISPYLFFWQASQEVEQQRAEIGEKPLTQAPQQARRSLHRIQIDTYVGMGFSNLVAFFIMLTAAATLHMHGIIDIQTSAQAAQALRPLAGEFAFLLFSAGIRRRRDIPMEDRSRSAAPEGEGLLHDPDRSDAFGCGTQLHTHRPDQGALLECSHQRCHCRPDHGGNHAHVGEARCNGPVRYRTLAESRRLDCDRSDGARGPRDAGNVGKMNAVDMGRRPPRRPVPLHRP
jgi:NRAMP (natural resistance-associated macrophage protein)-like metal ion transporter